mgnify:CR=1 FL=1
MTSQPFIEHVVPKNGKGGYTIAASEREDGRWRVTLCQCKPTQRYNKEIGARTATARHASGKWFVRSTEELATLLTFFKQKVDTQ